MNLIIDETDHPLIIKVASLQAARMQVYFIDNDDYFQNRLMAEDADGNEYADNDERTIFFARGVLETVKKLRWCPDVIHCHGWISSLVPLYIKSSYSEEPSFRDSKVVFSLYDTDFKNPLDDNFPKKLLCKDMVDSLVAEVNKPITYEELAKLAIRYSDGIILNSPDIPESLISYATELGKPVLQHQDAENYAPACNEFYDKVR
jgi:starch synthase